MVIPGDFAHEHCSTVISCDVKGALPDIPSPRLGLVSEKFMLILVLFCHVFLMKCDMEIVNWDHTEKHQRKLKG